MKTIKLLLTGVLLFPAYSIAGGHGNNAMDVFDTDSGGSDFEIFNTATSSSAATSNAASSSSGSASAYNEVFTGDVVNNPTNTATGGNNNLDFNGGNNGDSYGIIFAPPSQAGNPAPAAQAHAKCIPFELWEHIWKSKMSPEMRADALARMDIPVHAIGHKGQSAFNVLFFGSVGRGKYEPSVAQGPRIKLPFCAQTPTRNIQPASQKTETVFVNPQVNNLQPTKLSNDVGEKPDIMYVESVDVETRKVLVPKDWKAACEAVGCKEVEVTPGDVTKKRRKINCANPETPEDRKICESR